MATTRGRIVQINQVVLDQADFFQSDGFTREVGLVPGPDLTSQLFFKNELLPWPLITGAGVTDLLVKSGNVFWVEVGSSPGIYNIRFRPNAIGFWRLLITFVSGEQIMAQDYDVTSALPIQESGLKASFTKPC